MSIYRYLPLALLLSACQLPHQMPPLDSRISLPPSFEQAPDNPSRSDIASWWQQFKDEDLSQLIQSALQTAPDIAIAQARLAQATHTAQLAQSDLQPLVGAAAGTGIGLGTADNPLPLGSDSLNPAANLSQIGINASWTADFFGKKQSDADAATYAALSEAERLHGAKVMLAAQIAQHYIELRYFEAQMALLAEQQQSLSELRRYAQGRFAAGQATAYDREEINSQIAALQAQQAALQAQRDNHQQHIAALSGKTSLLIKDKRRFFTALPTAPSGHYPAELITRRPDIRARKGAVMARSAQIASAQADFYPRFSLNFGLLSGNIGLDGDLISQNLSGSGALLGANLQLPLFTAGRLQAQLDKAEAALQQALAEYDQTLLNALAEAQNSYRLAAALSQQAAHLAQAVTHKEKQIAQARSLFTYGRYTFDKIPLAQLAALQHKQHQLDNQRAYALNLVQLYSALGGGWE